LAACDTDSLGLFFRLILATGLRKSEALALQWCDIDFKAAQVNISKGWVRVGNQTLFSSPKTKNSKRNVPVPPNLLAKLQEVRKETLQLFEDDPFWVKSIEQLYIFGEVANGQPYGPDLPNKRLRTICNNNGIPQCRVHDLRHTYGSLQLRNKVPLEVVSERMGHANPTITLSIYRHLLEDERRGYIFDTEEMVLPIPRIPN
jgi:integrase